jgi:hypothetical protein
VVLHWNGLGSQKNIFYKMKKGIVGYAILFLTFLCSCIVRAPKYTGIEEALQLHMGMTKEEVSKALGIPPYDLKSVSDSCFIYIYKYRTTDRKTVPFFMTKTNGIKSKGKWVDLFVTYGKDGKVKDINSCSGCEVTKVTEKKMDLNSILLLVTVTVPSILLYLGLKVP